MRYTPKLHLPIFEKGETPALIGDLNAAMLTIDDNAGGGGGASLELIGSAAELRSTNPDGLTIDTSKMDPTKNQIVLVFYKTNNYDDGIYNPIMLSSYLNDTNTVMWQQSGSPNIQINKSAGKLYNYMGDSYVMYDVKVYLMTEGASGGSSGGSGISVVDEGSITFYSPETLGELMQDYEYNFVVVAGAIAHGSGSGTRDSYYFNSVTIPFYHGGTITEEDNLCLRLTAADNAYIEYSTTERSTNFSASTSSNISIEKNATVYGVKL